jgi:hypothetical protein
MSNNRLVLNGLAELRDALRKLPYELKADAQHIVEGAANGAAAEVKQNYVRGKTGNLIAGVSVRHSEVGSFGAGAIVINRAKHAWIYENGTQVRHTAKGAYRGVMPPAPPGRAFIPVMIKKRRQMYQQLKDLLVRAGLQVTGG